MYSHGVAVIVTDIYKIIRQRKNIYKIRGSGNRNVDKMNIYFWSKNYSGRSLNLLYVIYLILNTKEGRCAYSI